MFRQLAMVALSPAFFAMAFYESLVHIVLRWNQYLNTAQLHAYWSRTPITLAFAYYLLYVMWVIMSYFLGAYPPWWPFPQPLTAAGAKRPRCPCLPQCVLRLAQAVSRTPPVSRTPGATQPVKPELMNDALLTAAGVVTTADVTFAIGGVNPSPDANVQAVSSNACRNSESEMSRSLAVPELADYRGRRRQVRQWSGLLLGE